ncbi:unnamed protein product, partial [Heterotrigona itama]
MQTAGHREDEQSASSREVTITALPRNARNARLLQEIVDHSAKTTSNVISMIFETDRLLH